MNQEARSIYYDTPFDIAAFNGSTEVAKTMILHGVNTDPDIGAPLTLAASGGHTDMVKMLLDLKVNCDTPLDRNIWNPITLAALWGSKEIVRMLLDAGATVNYKNSRGRSALALASASGCDDVVQMLPDGKADINIVDLDGKTPLAAACQGDHTRVVQMLLDNKADPLIPDQERRSPLSLASAWGFAEIVEILLRARPTLVNITDVQGRSALHMVGFPKRGFGVNVGDWAPTQRPRTIEILLERGANAALRTTAGETILHSAAKSKESDHIPVLLQRMNVEDISAAADDGKTALDNAAEGRNRDAVANLLERSTCSFGEGGIDHSLLAWAFEDERTHGIVRMKLIQGLGTEIQSGPVNPGWGALDVAAYLGEYVMVQKLLRGLSSSQNRVGKIEHAIGVVDAVHGRPEDMAMAPHEYEDAIRGLQLGGLDKLAARKRTKRLSGGSSHTAMDNFKAAKNIQNGPLRHDDAKGGLLAGGLDELLARKKAGRFASGSSHRYMAIRALLKVAESSARTSSIAGELRPPTGTVDDDFRHDATIFDFYSSGSASTVSRHAASVESIVYEQGPEGVMTRRREDDAKAMGMVEELEWPEDNESQALKAEVLLELAPSRDEDFRLRWIHLPANNVSPLSGMMRGCN